MRGQLASRSLTESEAYQAKSELLSVQESLTDSYGSQSDANKKAVEKYNKALASGDTSSESIQKLANMLIELGIIFGEPVEGLENEPSNNM